LNCWNKKPMRLLRVAAVRRRCRVDRLASEAIVAAGRPVEAAEDVHQRALARARRAHDGDEFAGLDRERDAVQRMHGLIAHRIGLDQIGRFDQRHPPILRTASAGASNLPAH
jgi:hypothetical protein